MVESKFNEMKIPKRILNNLLTSLEAGVVPRSGAPYIAIGRTEEIDSLLKSLQNVEDGGATVRFLIGRYGSGKSFLIQLIRGYALERDFLCADADLSPERKLSGDGGIATYRELIRNISCKAMPEGEALPLILSNFYNKCKVSLIENGYDESTAEFSTELKKMIHKKMSSIEIGIGGFEFAQVLIAYFNNINEDSPIKSACLKWLRGEYKAKTEARKDLGFNVSSVIDNSNWYEYLKLWALLSVEFGYKGLIVYVDECINLYKITNRISRESNYEKILSIFNDTLQGRASYLGVIFGGTPQFLEDNRRGLFSYDALRSRLTDSTFMDIGFRNLSSPVIRLRRLSDTELFALIQRLTKLFSQKNNCPDLIDTEDMEKFLHFELSRVGASELVTPREIIRDYLSLLEILLSNHDISIEDLLVKLQPTEAKEEENESDPSDLLDFNF